MSDKKTNAGDGNGETEMVPTQSKTGGGGGKKAAANVKPPVNSSTHDDVVAFFDSKLADIAEFEPALQFLRKETTITGRIFEGNCATPNQLKDLFEGMDPPFKIRDARAMFTELFNKSASDNSASVYRTPPKQQSLEAGSMLPKLTVRPVGSMEVCEISNVPACFDELMATLSELKWEDAGKSVLNNDGTLSVRKVYYRLNGEDRQSFTGLRTFSRFIDAVMQRGVDVCTIDLMLWHTSTGSAPATPDSKSADLQDKLAEVAQYLEVAKEDLRPFGGVVEDMFHTVNGCIVYQNDDPCLLVDALRKKTNWSNEEAVSQLLDPLSVKKTRLLIGPSGVGKSSTVLRALTKEFGIYAEIKHSDLTASATANLLHAYLLDAKRNKNATEVTRAFHALQIAFLLVLREFKTMFPNCTAAQWTYLMVSVWNTELAKSDAVDQLVRRAFRMVHGLNLGYAAVDILHNLTKSLECHRFYIDEAQQLLEVEIYGEYTGLSGTQGRPVFSQVLTCGKGLVFSGTGLKMWKMLEIVGSGIQKPGEGASMFRSPVREGDGDPQKNDKARERTDAAIESVITVPGCLLEDVKDLFTVYSVEVPENACLTPLVGRSRLVANFVSRRLCHPHEDFDAAMAKIAGDFTQDLANEMNTRLTKLVKDERGTPTTYAQLALQLLRAAIWHEGMVQGNCLTYIDFIDGSMCMLYKGPDHVQATIKEAVAIAAIAKLCDDRGWYPVSRGVIQQMHAADPSTKGFLMEQLFVADIAMRVLDPRAQEPAIRAFFGNALEGKRVSAWPSRVSSPNNFMVFMCKPGQRYPTLVSFLTAAQNGDLDSKRKPIFCFPEPHAGPDVVTLLKVQHHEDDGDEAKYLLLAQSKCHSARLGGEKLIHALQTVDPCKLYEKRLKPGEQHSPEWIERRDTARKLCRKFQGHVRMLVATAGIADSKANRNTLSQNPSVQILAPQQLKTVLSREGFATSCPTYDQREEVLRAFSVKDLQRLLRDRGLSVSGTKSQLVDRLGMDQLEEQLRQNMHLEESGGGRAK